ncbi:MMPL family transporter [Thermococcus gorgonarius]|uniref:Multidrug RND transporter n=1 Tax=Thermococcus gorgonarius TaxID=71997 RepID=A0A2Z2MAG4_THEGO|nr:efflux RND transporter permease subunit [Thermococcus gorgonarius]ASJ01505.1 multidrug RND transporter [Thermococcus gorgonarius]
MAWNEWIAKHAKLVLLAWIVVIILMSPLAAKLSEVTNYSEEQMVSHNIESIKVQDIISEEFSEARNENLTYLLITNISVNDERAREAYYSFKERVEGKYADNVTSYYDALDELWNMTYDLTLNITRMTANVTGLLYTTAVQTNEGFGQLLAAVYQLDNTTEMVKNGLIGAAQGYLALKQNVTDLYNQTVLLRDALNQTDLAYFVLHRNLTSTAEMLKSLNSTLAELNQGLYTLNATYGNTYMGVIAVHKAILASGAYDRGNLTQAEAQAIASQTGTTPEFVYAVFNSVYPVYARAGTQAITDAFLANVTEGIVKAGSPAEQVPLVEAYGKAFYFGVKAFDEKAGSEYALQGMGPEELTQAVSEIATSALQSLPEIIAQSSQTVEVEGFGTIDAKTFSGIVETAISLGPNPSAEAVENAAVEVAFSLIGNAPNNPLSGLPNAKEVLKELLKTGPTKELERSILLSGMAENLPAEASKFAPLIVDAVLTYDENATGVLSKDPAALEEATISVLKAITAQMGLSVEENLLKELYESNGSPEVLDKVALEMLKAGTGEQLSKAGVPNAEAIADIIVKTATEDPQGIISGERLEEATIEVVSALSSGMGGNVEFNVSEIVKELYEGADPRELAENLFLEGAREQMENANVSVPEEFRGVFLNLTETIVKNYPMSEEEIAKLVKETVRSFVDSYAKNNPYGIEIAFDSSKLVDIAFEFKDRPNAMTRDDVKPLAEELFPTVLEKAGTYLSMLKSDDNTTMLITFVPRGRPGPSEDIYRYRAENATLVKKIALEELGKYFPEAEGALGGTPVEAHEMTEYGRKDNSVTTRASMIMALVVLFILMGMALLATFLPFTGVATSALTALGIAYLLARGGIIDIGSWAQMLTITTALGLGIDYSTYYVHRFREYIAEGYDHEKAVAEALRRAKDAVLASAFTDIIAFASFVLAWEFPIFQQMGIIAPLAVVSVLIASLTFIPAITALIGDKSWFWWPRHIRHASALDVHERSRIAEWVVKHAKVVLIIALLIAAPATYTFVTFKGTHDMSLFLPEDSDTLKFMTLSEEKLGASLMSPNYVIIEFSGNVSDDDLKLIDEITAHIATMGGVKAVYSPTRPYGEPVSNLTLSAVKALGGDRFISSKGDKVLLQVESRYRPTDEEAKNLVKALRTYVREVAEKNPRIKAGLVGGGAALSMDLTDRINDIFWHRIIPVALVLMFLSLIPTLKGLPAVASTMITIFLGVMTSIWVSTWLFEKVFGQEVMWFLPLMVFVVLMGVGIDYNSFYLVKARDEFERRKPDEALIVAAGTMDILVIGLAVVLASTYGALMLSSTWGTREMGFALAAGILLTATMAVYLIGPAFMSLFSEKAWWPLFKNRGEAEKK